MNREKAYELANLLDETADIDKMEGATPYVVKLGRDAAAALRQLADERDTWEKHAHETFEHSRVEGNALRDKIAELREERDREERLLRAGWSVYWLGNAYAWKDDDLRFVTHPDRAEAARLAEAKEEM
jgi:hypothetical protein